MYSTILLYTSKILSYSVKEMPVYVESLGKEVMSLEEIGELIENRHKTCHWCDQPLTASDVDCYPHDGGIPVYGFHVKQWVYFTCRKCGYQWALWKLLK